MYSLRIVDPITGDYTNVFSDRVMTLIKEGYTINDILTMSKQILPVYNRVNVFSNDMLYNYMLHLDINDIKSLCQVDKKVKPLCDDPNFWKVKIIQDFDGYMDMNKPKKKTNEKLNIDDITYDIKTYEALKFAKDITDNFKNHDLYTDVNFDQLKNVINLSSKFYEILQKFSNIDHDNITLIISPTLVLIEVDEHDIQRKRTNGKYLILKMVYNYPDLDYEI